MSAVLAIIAILSTQVTAPNSAADAFAADATAWLLDGKSLPPDWKTRLQAMQPADRLQSLIFLRRSGLLTTQGWTADEILAPAKPLPEETR